MTRVPLIETLRHRVEPNFNLFQLAPQRCDCFVEGFTQLANALGYLSERRRNCLEVRDVSTSLGRDRFFLRDCLLRFIEQLQHATNVELSKPQEVSKQDLGLYLSSFENCLYIIEYWRHDGAYLRQSGTR